MTVTHTATQVTQAAHATTYTITHGATDHPRSSYNATPHVGLSARIIALALTLSSLSACQSDTLSTRSLSFKFGACLGELDDAQSCSTRLLGDLDRDAVGCWVLSGAEEQYRQRMRWSGAEFTPLEAETVESFPFRAGDRVDIGLFVFSIPVTEEFCQSLTATSPCALGAGCRARVSRAQVELSYDQPISLQSPDLSCDVETPEIRDVEICDSRDNDCDGALDEGLSCGLGCVEGTVEACVTDCGDGTRICVNGAYGGCEVIDPPLERCDEVDNDCDGFIDESLNCADCQDGDTQVCMTRCGAGEQRCVNGLYDACDAPAPRDEVCGGGDEDCDGEVDEELECGGCVEGETRDCQTTCGGGQETCLGGVYQGCSAPLPTAELCDGVDNDCDELTDEETELGRACSVTYEGCAGEFPGVYICTDEGADCLRDGARPSSSTPETCNGLDDNCDGVIDNLPSASCRGEVVGCSYSSWVCPPNRELGVTQPPICDGPETPPAEVCNGLDDDCNGVDDDLPEIGNVCPANMLGCEGVLACPNNIQGEQSRPLICEPRPNLEVCDGRDNNCSGVIDDIIGLGESCDNTLSCGSSELICPDNITPGAPQDAICQINEEIQDEICDGIDNDCDDQVDEEQVCGRILHDRCAVSLVWAITQIRPSQTLSGQFPPQPSAGCSINDNEDNDTYSCGTANSTSYFQVLNINTSPTSGHWLALAWSCDTSGATQNETTILNEVLTHCAIGIGYADSSVSWNRSLSSCGNVERIDLSNNMARCARVIPTGNYGAIELGGGTPNRVNSDQFAIAFACRSDMALSDEIVDRLQSEFKVFLGSTQDGDTLYDNEAEWGELPYDSLRDTDGSIRGGGTPTNGEFGVFNLENRSLEQLSIYTHLQTP